MRIETRKRVTRALLAASIAAGQPLSPATAAERGPHTHIGPSSTADSAPAGRIAVSPSATAATAAGCPASISCGTGCVAELSTGFCILAVKWSGGVKIGSFQIGPTVSAECRICDCWYTYTNSNGDKIFKRTTDLDCDASVGDLYVV